MQLAHPVAILVDVPGSQPHQFAQLRCYLIRDWRGRRLLLCGESRNAKCVNRVGLSPFNFLLGKPPCAQRIQQCHFETVSNPCELPRALVDQLPKIETEAHDPIEAAERIIARMQNPPEIQHAGSKAFYRPITDRITLPPSDLSTIVEAYYATLLHEICTVASVLVEKWVG
jgi:hypothetical protein